MENNKRIAELAEEKYQITFGVKKKTFDKMLRILEIEYENLRKKGGRRRKLTVLDMLIITLGYYHDYRTMENIAFDYGVYAQRVCEAIHWVEQTLIKDKTFSLPSKRSLLETNTKFEIGIIDVTECETERPKYKQKSAYSGKKTAYDKRPNFNKWQK